MIRNSNLANAVTALDVKMRREAKEYLAWSRFTGEVTRIEQKNNDPILRPSGQFIDIVKKKAEGLGDRMIFPLDLELTGPGRGGDSLLLGYEEDPAMRTAMISFNQVRHAVPLQKGRQDYENEYILNRIRLAQPHLSWWHARMENWYVTSSIYHGASENLTSSTTDPVFGAGLGLDIRHHPNLYVFTGASQAAGALTRVGTAGKFPTALQVRDAVKNLNGSDHTTDLGTNLQFDTYTLNKMRLLCFARKIKPLFVKNGKKFWGVYISPAQRDTLFADSNYKNAMNSQQWASIQDHPLVNGSIGYYNNFVIFEDDVVVRGYYTATDSSACTSIDVIGSKELYWDDQNKSNPRFEPIEGALEETGGKTNHAAIIVGAGGLGKADRNKLRFDDEIFDYGNWKGLAASQNYGYGRMDWVGQNDFLNLETASADLTGIENRSTAIVVTWQ